MVIDSTLDAWLPQYQPPRSGFMSYLPSKWVPYAELMRVDKPVGALYLYFPCIFGTLLAGSLNPSTVPPIRLLTVNLIFLLGCFLVRCVGCTWNDIVDQDADRKVSRTRLRPMARGAVPTFHAVIFAVAQVLLGLILLWVLLPRRCLYYSCPSMLGTAIYPFGKRFTHYPQLILGCVFSWGVVMAFPALDLAVVLSTRQTSAAAACLFVSCVAWTLVYDTIYAAQDFRDDIKAGIKSPVVRHQGSTCWLLLGAVLAQVLLLCGTGTAMAATSSYFLCTCVGTALIQGTMVSKVDLGDPKDCIWWFRNGCFMAGATIFGGFFVEYVSRIV